MCVMRCRVLRVRRQCLVHCRALYVPSKTPKHAPCLNQHPGMSGRVKDIANAKSSIFERCPMLVDTPMRMQSGANVLASSAAAVASACSASLTALSGVALPPSSAADAALPFRASQLLLCAGTCRARWSAVERLPGVLLLCGCCF